MHKDTHHKFTVTSSANSPSYEVDQEGFLSTSEEFTATKHLGEKWGRFCVEYGGASQVWLAQIDANKQVSWISSWPKNAKEIPIGVELQKKIIRDRKKEFYSSRGEPTSKGIFPIFHNHQLIGIIVLLSSSTNFFTDFTIGWIETFAEAISASLIQISKATILEQGGQLVNRILRSRMHLREDLQPILDRLSGMVNADAVLVYKHNQAGVIRYDLLPSYGIETQLLKALLIYPGEQIVGRKCPPTSIQFENLTSDSEDRRSKLLYHEGYQTYISFSLGTEEDIHGILEVFWRTPQDDKSVLQVIDMVGKALSWAFTQSNILHDLNQCHNESLSTLTATLEGLSRALELRDLETEGHTQRVGKLTLRLARHMQIPEEQLEYLFQGALLHDIGKLGIPDAILLKPGSLSAKEWEIMKQHPQYAYNIFAPMVDVHSALDIPLYHHERWNGTGYPFGYKGEDIPLFARIFAVVDVFDALTSDRPYRSAWSRSQAITYIQENAGVLFDPQIVDKFLNLLTTDICSLPLSSD